MGRWFRNNNTDCLWEITDEVLIERLLKDIINYTEVIKVAPVVETIVETKVEEPVKENKKTGRTRKSNGTINNK